MHQKHHTNNGQGFRAASLIAATMFVACTGCREPRNVEIHVDLDRSVQGISVGSMRFVCNTSIAGNGWPDVNSGGFFVHQCYSEEAGDDYVVVDIYIGKKYQHSEVYRVKDRAIGNHAQDAPWLSPMLCTIDDYAAFHILDEGLDGVVSVPTPTFTKLRCFVIPKD